MSASCQLCERNETDGYLCGGCTWATARTLDRMPRLYEALAAFLQPSGRRPEFGRSRPAEAPLPISEPAFNLRGPGGMVGVLEDWRSAMQADRGWGEPVVSGTIGRRVGVAARALSMNLDWIAASWPMAGPFAEEIRALERDGISIVNPPERSLRLGNCPAVYEDGVVCGAVLRVPAGTAKVECRWCGTTYPPETWLELRSLQSEGAA
ncbi:hypothetical protein PV729_46640 [Streptomyces europaeiscabiei]|uniref:Uncharacterized protein n=1 Tax=Streptomyces europaeiscabiei TaxID=146819 RepID=A0ABU4NDS8_9ACTN|nr:hypothetical protein [Streptomyces europaeiscabiei]MDX3559045.1 hypothetical protein [Streptomyces europaeiscabiei]MDX3699620.1 hypothetical protein [Streptomyces europaeiscabiei]